MRLLQIYQRILKIKTSLAVAWSRNEIPKQRTTGGPVIVFKDTIKVNIYWGNQRPQANGGHDRLKKKKTEKREKEGKKPLILFLFSAMLFVLDARLLFGFGSSSLVYMNDDSYLWSSSWVVTTDPLRNCSLCCFIKLATKC